jgi:hypothetical protein
MATVIDGDFVAAAIESSAHALRHPASATSTKLEVNNEPDHEAAYRF